MGNLTGTEDVHLPKYVQALGCAMAECSYAYRVHLARRSNDTDTRRVLSFWPSDKGRFIAELAWDKKKYSFDITPRDDITFLDCGNAIVRAVKDYAPGLPLEGEELFFPPPVDVFMKDISIDKSSHQNATALSDGPLTDDNHAPHTVQIDTPTPHIEETASLFTAPAHIWNVRTLALYYAALEGIFGHNDPSEYLLMDDHHGKIRALTKKIQNYFAAAAGSVHRALEPLRQHKVVEKDVTADNTPTGWWIVRFVTDAPPAGEKLETLWDSRKGRQGKLLESVLPANSKESTDPVPKLLDACVQDNQLREDRNLTPVLPGEFDAKVEMLRTLQRSLSADVHAQMNTVYATIEEFCRQQNEELTRQHARFADFLTTQDILRIQDVSMLLTRLLEKIKRGQ